MTRKVPRFGQVHARRIRGVELLAVLMVTTIALAFLPGTAAADDYEDRSIEWSLQGPLPSEVETGEQVQLTFELVNKGTIDLKGGSNKATVEVIFGGNPLDRVVIPELLVNQSITHTFKFKFSEEGDYSIKLNAYSNAGPVVLYKDGQVTKDLGTISVVFVEEPFNWMPVIGAVVAVVVVVALVFVVKSRREKAEETRRLEEEARRQELIRKKEQEIAKKIEVRDVAGKHPRDYWVLRRQKYANYKPSGMTSSGLNVLKREKTKAEKDAERATQCPKCGTALPSADAECPRCAATEKVEAVRHQIRTYKSQAQVDFKDAEALIRKAEHRLSWSDFPMAVEMVEKAEAKMQEIWEASQKGETVASTVVEYTDAKTPTLDAKVISMEGEDVAIPTAGTEEVTTPAASEAPGAETCPACGNLMEGDVCYHCEFSEMMDVCWGIIENGETDGAQMEEAKGLCRQAHDAKERGSDEMAVRYLRRASSLAKDSFADHARSKTEGIVQFTQAQVDQVKAMGEDVSVAEQMLSKAKAAMAEGDHGAARSMAAKADGYLKQMKEDVHRKRVAELLPEVEAGMAGNEQVAELVRKAKKLIEAKELEGAVDLLEAAKSRL